MSLDQEITLNSISTEEQNSQTENGIGMNLDEVQALLAKKNEVIVDKDDPILITVTILNAFLEEGKKQQDKYMLALKTLYADQVNDFLGEVTKSTEEVRETLKSVSTEGLVKINERQTAKITELQVQLRNTCIIIGMLVLLNIGVMVWG